MEAVLIQNALAYAARHQLQLAERLGFGVHGMIFVAENKSKGGKTAVKAHREVEPYRRECAVYERLKRAGVTELLGFHVPQFIQADDELRAIEIKHRRAAIRARLRRSVSRRAAGFPGRSLGGMGSGEAGVVRRTMAHGRKNSGRAGRIGHLHGGRVAEQHRVPG